MNARVTDVHRTLAYGNEKEIRTHLWVALALAGCGVVGTLVDAYDVPQVFAWLMLFVGLGWAGWALLRLHERRTVLVLSPSGILLRGLRDILIPWPEICGVDSVRIDATEPVTHRPAGVTFDNVTVVLVSKSFYDAEIHIDSRLLRGPGWQNVFMPKGSLVQIAFPPQ